MYNSKISIISGKISNSEIYYFDTLSNRLEKEIKNPIIILNSFSVKIDSLKINFIKEFQHKDNDFIGSIFLSKNSGHINILVNNFPIINKNYFLRKNIINIYADILFHETFEKEVMSKYDKKFSKGRSYATQKTMDEIKNNSISFGIESISINL
jgi:hypothetical protein